MDKSGSAHLGPITDQAKLFPCIDPAPYVASICRCPSSCESYAEESIPDQERLGADGAATGRRSARWGASEPDARPRPEQNSLVQPWQASADGMQFPNSACVIPSLQTPPHSNIIVVLAWKSLYKYRVKQPAPLPRTQRGAPTAG